MPRALTLKFKNQEIVVTPEKVDRSKLYGYIDIEALDAKGRKCQLATLAEDGRTIVGMGGSAFAYLSPDGEWLEKAALKAVDREGKPVVPVPSTYAAPVAIKETATMDEYLSHNIKNVYALKAEAGLDALAAELKKGTIYTFPYSFRGGLEADAAFLLAAADGTIFLCIGQPTTIHFVGLEQMAPVIEDETEAEEDDDSVDFGMM
jgi:hypothetical protein